MGSAYTPGLTVSSDIVVRKVRRLPIKGEVLVQAGARVEPQTSVARALLPGLIQTIKLAEKLGVEAREVRNFFQKGEGDPIESGEVIAQTKGFFGIGKQTITSDYSGTVESISEVTGNILVREAPIPVEIDAYVTGKVAEVIPDEGAIIETRGAMVQGIFGIGGERTGDIKVVVDSPDVLLGPQHMDASHAGKIIVGGCGVTLEGLRKASELGIKGIIVGAIRDSDLVSFLGYDIGVAITGQELIDLTVLVTEGFGELAMADRTFKLLKSIEGQMASLNGATQIRAGVIRPELIVPNESASGDGHIASGGQELKAGAAIRIIREPYFGKLGTVTDLPAQLMVVESGTEVRVLKAKLSNGEEVIVPRANVEIIAT